jgi:putative FmdB family regulatory protein
MAVYQYKCINDHIYEEMRSIKDDQKVFECPECSESLKQIYSDFGISLKGSGFYRNSR